MNLKNYDFKTVGAKVLVALLLAAVPYLVTKATNPALATTLETNAAPLVTAVVAAVFGVDANSLHTQNSIQDNQNP